MVFVNVNVAGEALWNLRTSSIDKIERFPPYQ
jgi:hypothetical protein